MPICPGCSTVICDSVGNFDYVMDESLSGIKEAAAERGCSSDEAAGSVTEIAERASYALNSLAEILFASVDEICYECSDSPDNN